MFKIYTNGDEFISENKMLLDENILDTSFYYVNAKYINGFNRSNYLIKVFNEDKCLLLCKYSIFNLLLYGDKSLSKEACQIICDYNLEFNGVLATKELAEEFYLCYEAKRGGSHSFNLSMDIMYCNKKTNASLDDVRACNINDKSRLIELCKEFGLEALGHIDEERIIDTVNNYYDDFYCAEIDGRIVSICRKTRNEERICSISYVYTDKAYRGRGLAKMVVGKLTNDIVGSNKIAYLYVDKKNPISNHVYSSLGYEYGNSKYEVKYNEGNIKALVLAGGCFWCMAKPYYEYDGVIRVLSGYVGGDYINPTYEEVKKGDTGFKEGILIEYNSDIISFNELLDIYFDTIDPFDNEGQFMDRGSNYTCAIYSNDVDVINYSKKVIEQLELRFNKKAYVPILNDVEFYKAEEYHQDYALKNPKEMEQELISSGRKNK